ncbi:DNA-directed RNA polymerase subunit L [Candidatus Woesearchaeota archaeon]|nr:DNA-directed RNA polymerase subunit L [Candidatus Woesearchaeota archaeon]
MEMKVLEEKKGKLVFELDGVSHTVCNVLKKELWNDKHIKNVGYAIRHPLIGKPEFVVETDGADARKIVGSACQKLKKEFEKFSENFKKAS